MSPSWSGAAKVCTEISPFEVGTWLLLPLHIKNPKRGDADFHPNILKSLFWNQAHLLFSGLKREIGGEIPDYKHLPSLAMDGTVTDSTP